MNKQLISSRKDLWCDDLNKFAIRLPCSIIYCIFFFYTYFRHILQYLTGFPNLFWVIWPIWPFLSDTILLMFFDTFLILLWYFFKYIFHTFWYSFDAFQKTENKVGLASIYITHLFLNFNHNQNWLSKCLLNPKEQKACKMLANIFNIKKCSF